MSRDPLALDPERMRRMGHAVVDLLVDRIAGLADEPVLRTATPAELAARIDRPPSGQAQPFDELLARLERDVLAFVGHFDHPRFLGYIPGAGTWPAALGDFIAAATNIDAGGWREAAGPSQLELTVLGWFADWIGYPPTAAGVLVSGGSAANLTAIACARETLVGPMSPTLVAYTSDQTHSSVARAMRHLGFRPEQLRVLPTDGAFRIRLDDLAAAIEADAAAGRIPFLVSANAGTTNTGAIDPLVELSALCRARRVWLHVDGAYGAFAVLTDRGRQLLAGLELADSVTLDPHKWLAMPFEVGCLLVRDGSLIERAFTLHPEYLRDGRDGEAGVSFADRGLQLTRAARAIKVWLAIEAFGLDAFRVAIDRSMDQVLQAQRWIEEDERLELVTPACLGILTFRRRGAVEASPDAVDTLNRALVAELARAGDVLLTTTSIAGRLVVRLCVLNHTTDDADVRYAIERVASVELPQRASASRRVGDPAPAGSTAVVAVGPGRPAPIDLVRRMEIFDSITDEQAERLLEAAEQLTLAAGEVLTERWAFARTFYVVLEGRLSVRVGKREVNVLGSGDHLGEIAAIDWGRDFSYGRTATVVAVVPTTALAIPGDVLRALMVANAEVDRRLRRVAHERLAVR